MRKTLPTIRPVFNPIPVEIPVRQPLFGPLPHKGSAYRKIVEVEIKDGEETVRRPYHITKGWRDGR